MHDVLELAPAGSTVFAGNSLPVRHLDQFGRPGAKPLFAHANRGVSGIDGNVSSALGLGLARDGHPLIAIIGDVTLYHDMNGLLAARRNNVPMLLVVLNNNGGGIFQRLPVNAFDPEFTEHFVTPHGLDYRHAAALYGFEHMRVTDRAGFQSAFTQALAQPAGFHMIEVHTDARQDLRARGAFLESMRSVL
jgi:2-succinyl-5-enolpyruvyl-6-hydroxy-3-cyclohexene-1-carboxylate synthase